MKSTAAKREYRQTARAEAAEATAERIVAAFSRRLETHWFDEIRLEDVAAEAEVSVPTIVRRFGGKEALLQAVHQRLGDEINARRAVEPGDVDGAIRVLAEDYEAAGDFVMRGLAQEDRYTGFKFACDMGRKYHRHWVGGVFAPALAKLSPADAQAALDRLVIATDVYIWKLMRRDMGRPLTAYRQTVRRLIDAALHGDDR